jgi:hypothetical protein
MFSIPYSKKKNYLSGMDWVANSLDEINKKEIKLGNHSAVVLVLKKELDVELFTQRLKCLDDNHVLKGKLSRDLNLAPYWKVNLKKKPRIKISTERTDNVFKLYCDFINEAFGSEDSYLEFKICFQEDKSYVCMKFDHRILDARGAEMVLNYLNGTCIESFHYNREPYLRNWKDNFLAGRTIVRFLIGLNSSLVTNSLAIKKQGSQKNIFSQITFNKEESKKIIDDANEKAGYLMIMPYLLAKSTQAFDKCFFANKSKEAKYIVSVNADRRPKKEDLKSLFFNHFSFCYFGIDTKALFCETIYEELKKELYLQIKDKIAEAFELASRLARILPLCVMAKVMKDQVKKNKISFSFSYVGQSGYQDDSFMDNTIQDVFHLPIVPIYPGIGIYFTKFKDKIQLVLSANQSIVTEKELCLLTQKIKDNLI